MRLVVELCFAVDRLNALQVLVEFSVRGIFVVFVPNLPGSRNP